MYIYSENPRLDPSRPAVKGATDTSNFDDYPDSDQEPPAVNALGRLEPDVGDQFGCRERW